MTFKMNKFKIEVESMVIIVALLNIIPYVRKYLESYYICFLFILFHELSHIFVASLFGARIKKLCIKICGLNAVIDMIDTPNIEKCLIYAAGPASNLLLAILFKNIPLIFYTNISLMAINLIIVKPLDGYNIMNIILGKLKHKEKALGIIQKMFFFFFVTFGLVQIILLKNPSILLILMYIYIIRNKDKSTGKKSIYQKYYKNVTKFLKNY